MGEWKEYVVKSEGLKQSYTFLFFFFFFLRAAPAAYGVLFFAFFLGYTFFKAVCQSPQDKQQPQRNIWKRI